MRRPTPIERDNLLLESTAPLTIEDKAKFAYFGIDAKILPPLRILNPQNIVIGDRVTIRDGCHINAFRDLSFIREYIDPAYRDDFRQEDFIYDGRIVIDHTCQIGRFFFASCTRSITIEPYVLLSERIFIGDNNHGYSHAEVPILHQPNDKGEPVVVGTGTWIGAGAAILKGVVLGRNTVVGANSVVKAGTYPSHAVIAPAPSVVQLRR